MARSMYPPIAPVSPGLAALVQKLQPTRFGGSFLGSRLSDSEEGCSPTVRLKGFNTKLWDVPLDEAAQVLDEFLGEEVWTAPDPLAALAELRAALG